MSEPTVFIEEVFGRAKQGVTLPFLCKDGDGVAYFVKGMGAGRRSQVCEWVAGQLATAFGLPVADYALAEVPSLLITASSRRDIGELGEGIVFASRELPHAQELTPTTRDLVSEQQAMDVLVFDWWLHNEDRHLTELGGNPNLLWDFQADGLAVIDHNQAFDPAFNVDHFLELHVFSVYWNRVFSDFDLRRNYEERMVKALAGLDAIRDSIPDPWWFAGEGVPANIAWDEIVQCLNRCRREDFWNIP